ncbi:connector enhancer of kinase suppressor of ras 2-like isoform X2 [Gigantopelta aegis]|uniref:connector enhancer of kinase suppressor of ras 2-like isoform X2 n=1 Tax=Gigantopelta aegis TaxID=1735272 RepID=UPI001B888DE5|nr:connector enhancer of kinase suppressor of ras 2-like isoform X2 [Gigantopelta aegis]
MKMAEKRDNTNSHYIHFENWTPEKVANWLKGLDEAVLPYIQSFVNHDIDGKRLLMLTHSDLEKLNIKKLGHQELILEAVDILRAIRYGYETENLQHLALQLGCKARSLHNMVHANTGENDKNIANVSHHAHRHRQWSITILSATTDVLMTLKALVSWLDKAPFEGIYDMILLRNTIVKTGLDVGSMLQKDTHPDVEESIIKSCRKLSEICDELVMNSKEPLVVQPASLELATIRKKQGEELGLHISSLYYVTHSISGIKELSPADLCRKIEKGDELIQVNNQTVLGWQLKKLVETLKEKPKEVILLLKKRPRHISPFGVIPNRRKQLNKQHAQAATLPKSLKKRRSRDGESKQPRPSLQEYGSKTKHSGEYLDAKEPVDGNDTDNDVFRSGSESPQFTLPVTLDPKYRRATVSGGSPILERPSLVIEDLDPPRPKSQAVNTAEKEAVFASLVTTDNALAAAVQRREKSAFSGTEGVKIEITPLPASEDTPVNTTLVITSSESTTPTNTIPTSTTPLASTVCSKVTPDIVEDTKLSEQKGLEFRVTKPTPHILENPYQEAEHPWSSNEGVIRVVATDVNKDQPHLRTIKRIDSSYHEQTKQKEKQEENSKQDKKHVGFSEDTKENEKEANTSFTHIIVGGVVQKIPAEKVDKPDSPVTVQRRHKSGSRQLNRRVSCKDLGSGDCEGWLYKRKLNHRGPLTKHWEKRWCVLKNHNLFYFKNQDELKAEGVIHLPAFQVSPAPDIKTKKFAFKVHNSGTRFCFASERQEDMSKWMNKMGLAAISFDTKNIITTGGFIRPELNSQGLGVQNQYYSESDDDPDDTSHQAMGSLQSLSSVSSLGSTIVPANHTSPKEVSTESPPSESPDTVEVRSKGFDEPIDDLTEFYRLMHEKHMTITGIDRDQLRRSQINTSDVLEMASSMNELKKLKHLKALQRTLKAKNQELCEIDHFLSGPLTHEKIQDFVEHYPDAL